MRRIGFSLAASAILLAQGAFAQQPPPVSSQQIARACAGDIERLCPGVPPGEGRIKACMKEHITQVSAPCFDTLLGAVAASKEP